VSLIIILFSSIGLLVLADMQGHYPSIAYPNMNRHPFLPS
jgi:hypothetical protein